MAPHGENLCMEVRGTLTKRGDFGEFGGLGPPWRFASDGPGSGTPYLSIGTSESTVLPKVLIGITAACLCFPRQMDWRPSGRVVTGAFQQPLLAKLPFILCMRVREYYSPSFSLYIEKASLPTQRSGRCSSVVELGTCHLRPRFNSWLRADFCVFLITCGITALMLGFYRRIR